MTEPDRQYHSQNCQTCSTFIWDPSDCDTRTNCLVKAIDETVQLLEKCKADRHCLTNRMKLMQMRGRAARGEGLSALRKEFLDICAKLENPSLQIQRQVIIITGLYTFLGLISFGLIGLNDAIFLPGFNIPYTVLLMGLLGCLTSMYFVLPNFNEYHAANDSTPLLFIIKPPIAVIMAGLFFGLIQALLPIFEKVLPSIRLDLGDESWFCWIMAWCAGFIDWTKLGHLQSAANGLLEEAPKSTRHFMSRLKRNSPGTKAVSIDRITDYVQSKYNGLVVDTNWGDRGIFYNPDNLLPKGIHLMTFKVKDSRNDKASNLHRDGVYRLNMGIRSETFARHFGKAPPKPVEAGIIDSKHDFQALDQIMPHPKYGWCAWIAVLNPGPKTFESLKPMIDESYQIAKRKYAKRIDSLKLPN